MVCPPNFIKVSKKELQFLLIQMHHFNLKSKEQSTNDIKNGFANILLCMSTSYSYIFQILIYSSKLISFKYSLIYYN